MLKACAPQRRVFDLLAAPALRQLRSAGRCPATLIAVARFGTSPVRDVQRAALFFVPIFMLGVLIAASSSAQDSADADARLQQRIQLLIAQLADNNYHRRVDAKWELEKIGLAAFEQLRQATVHPDAQIARAARYLIDSQNVVWSLETDSVEVRELLRNYNESKEVDRDTSLQQLSEHGSEDALLALCRMARFESSDLRSKSAALYLMEAIARRIERAAQEMEPPVDAALPNSIRLTLGGSRRAASRWLAALMHELGPEQTRNLQDWKVLIAAEHASVSAPENLAGDELFNRESLSITLRFYRWLGSWITRYYGRAAALELVQPSLRLVGSNPLDLRTAAEWALEAELPELVPELSREYADQFASEPQLGYCLAEGYLRLGDMQAMQIAAEKASRSVLTELENLRKLPRLNLDEIQANRRYQLAGELTQRGLFEWAEKEYLSAIALEPRAAAGIREDLAQFYWFAGENAKAAETLRPVAEEMLSNADADLPNAPGVFNNPATTLAHYEFYLGLADIDRQDYLAAMEHLRRSLDNELAEPNPDVVIAMKKIATKEPFQSYFQDAFDEMSNAFRGRVFEAEEDLSRASDRMSRALAAPALATECNQLAWLLSKCEVSPQEALSLSLRSLELMPDEPVYLDTLARCYFAAGQLKDAVRVQQRAVKLAPFERQMIAQLTEFKQALAEQEAHSERK